MEPFLEASQCPLIHHHNILCLREQHKAGLTNSVSLSEIFLQLKTQLNSCGNE